MLCRNKQINWVRSWKDDSVVKNAFYSDIEPQFNSQQPQQGAWRQSNSTFRGSDTLFRTSWTSSHRSTYPHMDTHTFTEISKIK